MSDAPHFILSIDKNNESEGIKSFLTSIRALIWSELKTPTPSISIEHLTMGTSNRVFRCTVAESPEIALVRIYGEACSLLVDRDHELNMIRKISDGNVGGAHLYATFQNGYVLEYIKGTLLRVEDFANPHFYEQIAKQVADIHRIKPLPSDLAAEALLGKRGIWESLRRWLDAAQGLIMDDAARQHLNEVEKEVREYEAFMTMYNDQPLVFCHNDLNHANMLYDSRDGASQDGKQLGTPKITFLDLEYAGFNFRGFDLGNHFCEWSGLTLDFGRYPSKDQRRNFLSHYLKRVNDNGTFTEEELSTLLTECERFAQVSHLSWHVWSIALGYSPNKASDFDYHRYGAKRWAEYLRRKVECKDEIYGGL